MNIAVLMKPVLDCGVSLAIDEKAHAVVQKDQAAVWVVNPADRSALEAALQLKRGGGVGAQIFALSLAPAERTEAIEYAMAAGADRALIIEAHSDEMFDPARAACTLAAFLRSESIDLILCGSRSLDNASGWVGPSIAEHLGLPQVTGAVRLQLLAGGEAVAVQRRLEKGNREEVHCSLPAVVSVDPMIARPTYVTVYARLSARKKPLERLLLGRGDRVTPEESRTRIVRLDPPRPRPKKTFVPDVKLSAAERMKLIRSGGVARKKESESLSGTPDDIAEGIARFLQEKGFLG